MTGDVKDTLEIQSNKEPYHWALRMLYLFMIVFFTFALGLMIYEFGFNPEDSYGWGIIFPCIIFGLLFSTLIVTFIWLLFSKNAKFKSLTITSTGWRINTHNDKTIIIPSNSIKSIKIRIAQNGYVRLFKSNIEIGMRNSNPKRKYRLDILIRSQNNIVPCLLQSYIPMKYVDKPYPHRTGEFGLLRANAKRIAMLLEQPDYAFLRDKIEFKGTSFV